MNHNNLFWYTLSLIFCLTSCKTTDRQTNSISNPEISKIVDQLVAENDIPGLNLSIIYKDGHQENYSSGSANVELKVPLTSDHTMFSGSTGKTYAVAVLMQLVDEGKISLKDRIIDYFPEVEWLKHVPNINEIAIEMCLQHTTGLPRYAFKQGVWDILYDNPDKVWTYEDRLSFVFDDDPVHEAGKGWAYSDTNYILLGMLIEKITGKYYYDVVSERILNPQNLNTTFAADKREIPNLATGYSRLPEFFRLPAIVVIDGKLIFNPQMEWTGGGFATTSSDLAKWAGLYYGGTLFSDSLSKKIITPNSLSLLTENTDPYGMGSFIFPTMHGDAYGHTGFFPGFLAIFSFYAELDLAIALQINCDYGTEKMNLVAYLDRVVTSLKEQKIVSQ